MKNRKRPVQPSQTQKTAIPSKEESSSFGLKSSFFALSQLEALITENNPAILTKR
jgi:hypothetical protein